MSGPDFWQQQQLQQEREQRTVAVLHRIEQGMATMDDVEFLVSELGLSNLWRRDHEYRSIENAAVERV